MVNGDWGEASNLWVLQVQSFKCFLPNVFKVDRVMMGNFVFRGVCWGQENSTVLVRKHRGAAWPLFHCLSRDQATFSLGLNLQMHYSWRITCCFSISCYLLALSTLILPLFFKRSGMLACGTGSRAERSIPVKLICIDIRL